MPMNSSFRSKLNLFRVNSCKANENNETDSQVKLFTSNIKYSGSKGAKFTPLEQQVVLLKDKYPDTILFVECGYKYRFFGKDAEIASKELNIIAHLDHNFQTASIPAHRLHVHIRRLVAKGYKVGVVKQIETAALKAISNKKSTPFARELTALYTKSTLIGEDVNPVGNEDNSDNTEMGTPFLMVLMETKSFSGNEKDTGISLVAIQPSTGEILFDTFDDSETRTALWGRLEYIQPVEVILSENVSDTTTKAINAITTRHGDCIRLERLSEDVFEYSTSLKNISNMYEGQEEKIRKIIGLPQSIICCLGATLQYLKEFKLEKVLKTVNNISRCNSEGQFMKIPGATLRNLEVLVNSENGLERGSLFWVLNQTQTKFGSRILRQWLVKPLKDIERICERQGIIQELMTSDASVITWLKTYLTKLPDFQKSLTTIFYKKSTPHEFWITISGLSDIQQQLSRICKNNNLSEVIQHPSLVRLFTAVIEGLSDIHEFIENIDSQSAKENNKTGLLKNWFEFEDVMAKKEQIRQVENQLNGLLSKISKTLGCSSIEYSTVAGLEYLIEVKNCYLKSVPSNWNKISSTKVYSRFRTPEVEKFYTRLQQLREELQVDCHNAWLQILDRFAQHYQEYREAVTCLGTLDALLSLAKIAQANGYCRPEIIVSKESILIINSGKHPIVSQLKNCDHQFVSNDTNLKSDGKRVMIVTGPNMGGKSCYLKQVALIVLMAQIGSFVPAHSVEMTIVDGIYTRMGASDEIFSGKSTFMVEMGETADIINEATPKSLVILDELGRGTATYDGMAIALACLDYFIKLKCMTIFVTHYLTLSEFELLYPEVIGNHHMSFIITDQETDGIDVVTFLYQLASGSADQSYGLNVARLANVPGCVIGRAAEMSKSLKELLTNKKRKREQLKNVCQASKRALRSLISDL